VSHVLVQLVIELVRVRSCEQFLAVSAAVKLLAGTGAMSNPTVHYNHQVIIKW